MPEESRAGPVVVAPTPVMTVYYRPEERVLFSEGRDANPFFHLIEAMWMLAGRDDATFLDTYVHDFSQRFAEPDGHQHGAYGARWRSHWDMDQLLVVGEVLRRDPRSRQAVLTMWNPATDLGRTGLRDIPCNTQVYFRNNGGQLDIGVTCRSNDAFWGAYGANAVHFAFLQEYVAALAQCSTGPYYQMSWNFHIYEALMDKARRVSEDDRYPMKTLPLVGDLPTFMDELTETLEGGGDKDMNNAFLGTVVAPAMTAWDFYKQREYHRALVCVNYMQADDWRVACAEWIKRRAAKQ